VRRMGDPPIPIKSCNMVLYAEAREVSSKIAMVRSLGP